MQTMAIHKMGTPEEEKRKEVERRKFEEQEVKTAVGLSALLRKIADSVNLKVLTRLLTNFICNEYKYCYIEQ